MSKDLIRGFLLAHKAPQELLVALKELNPKVFNSPSESICEWGLSVRTVNALVYSDIKTLSDLMRFSEEELLSIPNFGRKSLNEIKDIIAPMRFPEKTQVHLNSANDCTPPSEVA